MEFHHAAYRAYWDERKDLGQLNVLAEVARSVSLDADEMIECLETHELSSKVMGQYQEALQHGIRGIPTFVVGNLMFTGAHPYDIFKSAMNQFPHLTIFPIEVQRRNGVCGEGGNSRPLFFCCRCTNYVQETTDARTDLGGTGRPRGQSQRRVMSPRDYPRKEGYAIALWF